VGFPHVRIVGLPLSECGVSARPDSVTSHVSNVCLHVPEHGVLMYLERGPRRPETPLGLSGSQYLHGVLADYFRVGLALPCGGPCGPAFSVN